MAKPARHLSRIGALIIDLSLFAVYLSILVAISLAGLSEGLLQIYPSFFDQPLAFDLLALVVVILPLVLYFALLEASPWQGTVGKRILKIKVEDLKGQRMGLGQSLTRTALKFLPWQLAHTAVFQIMLGPQSRHLLFMVISILAQAVVLIYIISAAVSKEHQSLYDRAVGSVVVKTGTKN